MRPHLPTDAAATMLSLFLGFAQIRADQIPDGIVPKDKRQIVGTGVTTSTTMSSTTDTPSSTTEAVSETTSAATSETTAVETTPTSTPETVTPTSEPTSATPTTQETTSDETTPTPSPSSTVITSNVPTTIAVTTTNSDGSTVTSQIATSVAVVRTTARSSSDSDIVVVGSSTINRSTLSSATVITSALVASETIPSTYTSYWTTDGQAMSSVITTARVVATTTGFATSTIAPSIQNGEGGSGSGLSDSSKKVIGGVVGGVGGAIVVGALAIVAWRLWGKKKRQQLPQDDYAGSAGGSVHKESHMANPSGNGLERYANPGGSVNTASNF